MGLLVVLALFALMALYLVVLLDRMEPTLQMHASRAHNVESAAQERSDAVDGLLARRNRKVYCECAAPRRPSA